MKFLIFLAIVVGIAVAFDIPVFSVLMSIIGAFFSFIGIIILSVVAIGALIFAAIWFLDR